MNTLTNPWVPSCARPLVVALVAVLWATPASAQTLDLQAGLGASVQDRSSFDAVSSDDVHTATSISAAWTPGLALGGRLWLDVDLEGMSADGTAFQSINTRTSATTLTAGARLAVPLWRSLSAVARIGIGSARVRTRLADSTGQGFTGIEWVPAARLSAGLELPIIGGQRMSVGLRTMFGYRQLGSQDVQASPDMESPGTAIGDIGSSLGSLNVSGWSTRLAIFARF